MSFQAIALLDGGTRYTTAEIIASIAAKAPASGNVAGSVGATDNRLPRSDGTGGQTLQATGITVDDSNNVSGTGRITSGGGIQFVSEITAAPSGASATITLNTANHQTLNLVDSTGSFTATFTVPSAPCSGTLIVKQHSGTARDITWAVSTGSIVWLGTEPTWNTDALGSYRIVSWRYNGSILFLCSTPASA